LFWVFIVLVDRRMLYRFFDDEIIGVKSLLRGAGVFWVFIVLVVDFFFNEMK
tara:strand:- start:1250 stop:1405 length:156 start_codon:yes stop_codon:yes gene_type:complete